MFSLETDDNNFGTAKIHIQRFSFEEELAKNKKNQSNFGKLSSQFKQS